MGLNPSASSFSDYPTLNDVINHFTPTERTLSSASVNSTPYLEADENDLGNKTEVRPVDSEPVVMATVRTTIAEDVGIPLERVDRHQRSPRPRCWYPYVAYYYMGTQPAWYRVSSTLLTGESHSARYWEDALPERHVAPAKTLHLPVMEQDIPLDSVTPTAFDGPTYTTSDRLQGSSENPRPILWLFPDGAASAASYTPLPAIAPVMLVHALDCPCLNTSPDLRCSSPQYALKFVPEISCSLWDHTTLSVCWGCSAACKTGQDDGEVQLALEVLRSRYMRASCWICWPWAVASPRAGCGPILRRLSQCWTNTVPLPPTPDDAYDAY